MIEAVAMKKRDYIRLYVLANLPGFADELDVRWENKCGIKDDSSVCEQRMYINWVVKLKSIVWGPVHQSSILNIVSFRCLLGIQMYKLSNSRTVESRVSRKS